MSVSRSGRLVIRHLEVTGEFVLAAEKLLRARDEKTIVTMNDIGGMTAPVSLRSPVS